MTWSIQSTTVFDQWFADLPEPEQVEVLACIRNLRVLGPGLGRPHADTLNGSEHPNMKELRARTGRSVLRIAFAFDPRRQGILLVGGNKAGVNQKRFYKSLIAKADALYREHLRKLK